MKDVRVFQFSQFLTEYNNTGENRETGNKGSPIMDSGFLLVVSKLT